MGVSKHPFELASKMTSFAGAVAAVPATATREVCFEAKRVMLASLAAVGVGSQRLRNAGRSGARLGVRFTVKTAGPSAVGHIGATGPWQLIEGPTRRHQIPRQRGTRSRFVRLPDGGVRRVVDHPGTHGKHPWRNGEAVVRQTAPEAYERGITVAARRIF